MVTDIIIGKNDNVEGVRTFFGMNFYAPSVVLTTGTFMSGKIWVGRTSLAAGRAGESASHGLTENLQSLGFETDRLKTGTPARVDIRSVDFSRLEPQHGDEEVLSFNILCSCSQYPSMFLSAEMGNLCILYLHVIDLIGILSSYSSIKPEICGTLANSFW